MNKLARTLLLVGACVGLLALLPVAHAQVDASDVPVDVASGVQQIHLAQGKTPSSMAISWLTPNSSLPAPASQVRYGLASNALTSEVGNRDAYTYTIPSGYAKPQNKAQYPTYTSGWLHNVVDGPAARHALLLPSGRLLHSSLCQQRRLPVYAA